MGFHTYPVERADALDDPSRYRFLSREELVAALDPGSDWTVADLGSGTGFYTDDVAPFAGTVYAVDVQEAMHDLYREKGVPTNVTTVTAAAADLPFDGGALDAAFSTMTYHEFYDRDALAELRRVLRPGGRVVHADWSSRGDGEDGPPLAERYDAERAASHHEEAGFTLETVADRPETFVLVATA